MAKNFYQHEKRQRDLAKKKKKEEKRQKRAERKEEDNPTPDDAQTVE